MGKGKQQVTITVSGIAGTGKTILIGKIFRMLKKNNFEVEAQSYTIFRGFAHADKIDNKKVLKALAGNVEIKIVEKQKPINFL